jgi:sulfopyruvate decarboxylase subunit beta
VTAVASAVPSEVVLAALAELDVTHVVTVPDTNQRTVLAAVEDDPRWTTVRAATEDDVLGVCLGLWMAGRRPLAVIQQLGLFAATNALRSVAHDYSMPLPVLAGLYGRELDRAVADSQRSAVRLCIPLLDALEIRWSLVEGPEEAQGILDGLAAAFDETRVSVVLLGAPTS